MKRKHRRSVALVLVIALSTSQVGICPLYAASTEEATQTRLRELIESGDARLDSHALNGAQATVLPNPERFEAGVTGLGIAAVIGLVLLWWESQKVSVSDDELPTKLARLYAASLPNTPTMPLMEPGDQEYLLISDEDIAAGRKLAKDIATLAAYVHESVGDTWVVVNTLHENIVFNTSDLLVSDSRSAGGELIRGGSFSSSSDLKYWENAQGAMAGLSSFGPIGAPQNSDGGAFGLIHTGFGVASNEGRMQQTILAPAAASATFTACYNFVTTDIDRLFNDSFFIDLVHVRSGATQELVRLEGSLNKFWSESDASTHGQFSGGLLAQILYTMEYNAGKTGWITVGVGGVNLQKGQQYMVRLRVPDAADWIVGSVLLVDKISLR